MQEFEHRAFGDQPLVVQPVHDLVMAVGGAALVHHLGLLLRIEVLRDAADDAEDLALPLMQARRPLFDEIEDVFLGQASSALRFSTAETASLTPGLVGTVRQRSL